MTCVFCRQLATGDLVAGNALAAAFFDAFPLNPGHCLVVPRRHESNFLALSPDEQAAMWALVPTVRDRIESNHAPDGYNLGVNVGEAAGQTISHAHLHVIPRYHGDVPDPRGGIRLIIPATARYWAHP